MADCTPSVLVEASKCFNCLTEDQLSSLIVYLLCQWTNV
jgi:hypothetical protein